MTNRPRSPPVKTLVLHLAALLAATSAACAEPDVAALAAEVRAKGWIAYCARSEFGDWDVFLMRPDGSQRRHLTSTPQSNEAAPQFSRDGARILFRRMPREQNIEANRHGQQGALVVANADGSGERTLGRDGEWPWASWSPDGTQVACLSLRGIEFVDLGTGRVRRTLPRVGFFQQLTWSPDGRRLSGVANAFGTGWSVAVMEVATGQATAVSRVNCCTPDWFPGQDRLIFSSRPEGQRGNNGYGWTQLWMADADGRNRRLVFGEDGRHVYGGQVSPDGLYVVFTGNPQEDGDPGNSGAPMGLVRLSDTPMIAGPSSELRALHPGTTSGPMLVLPAGWEPCWTASERPAGTRQSTP